jgi:hypothetical protein
LPADGTREPGTGDRPAIAPDRLVRRILLACEPGEQGVRAVHGVAALARALDATVAIVGVASAAKRRPPSLGAFLGLGGGRPEGDDPDSTVASWVEAAARVLRLRGIRHEVMTEPCATAQALGRLAADRDFDTIAVPGPDPGEDDGFAGSLANYLATHQPAATVIIAR